MAAVEQSNLGPMLRLVYVAAGVGVAVWAISSVNSYLLALLGGAIIVFGLIAWCPVCAALGIGKR